MIGTAETLDLERLSEGYHLEGFEWDALWQQSCQKYAVRALVLSLSETASGEAVNLQLRFHHLILSIWLAEVIVQ